MFTNCCRSELFALLSGKTIVDTDGAEDEDGIESEEEEEDRGKKNKRKSKGRKKEKKADAGPAPEENAGIDPGTSSEGVGTGFDAGTSSEGGDERLGFDGNNSEGADGLQGPLVALDGYASTDDMTTGTRPSDSDVSMRSNGVSDLSEIGERSALLTIDGISILDFQIVVARLLQKNTNPPYIPGVSVPHSLLSYCMR